MMKYEAPELMVKDLSQSVVCASDANINTEGQ